MEAQRQPPAYRLRRGRARRRAVAWVEPPLLPSPRQTWPPFATPVMSDDSLGVEIVDYRSHPVAAYYPLTDSKREEDYDSYIELDDELASPEPEPDPPAPLDKLTRWALLGNILPLICYTTAIMVTLWFSWAKDSQATQWLPNLIYAAIPPAIFGLCINVYLLIMRRRTNNPDRAFAVGFIGTLLSIMALIVTAMLLILRRKDFVSERNATNPCLLQSPHHRCNGDLRRLRRGYLRRLHPHSARSTLLPRRLRDYAPRRAGRTPAH